MPVSQATAVLLSIHVAVISINSSTQKQKKGLTNYFYLTEYLQQSDAESPFVLPVQQRKHLMFKHTYIYTRTVKLTKCLSEAAPECLPLSIVEQIGPLHLSHQQPEHTHTYTQQACL